MIDLYTANTGNGQRAALALEEAGLPYRVHKLDLMAGDQKGDAFQAVHPAGRIPCIVDPDGPGGPVTLSQSGAILVYVANKSGRLWPEGSADRLAALEWMMFACTDAAPWSGVLFQSQHMMPERSTRNEGYIQDKLFRFLGEANARLVGREYLAGTYSVADVALYPVVALRRETLGNAGGFANLLDWAARVGARPAIQKGMAACR
ncbi:MAG: glutathione S-transferase family protein [Rhodocyclaceae bacterium]|nr:glutathione S-transferase family protein [Rhodocyclaceae bacterium]